jgi:serine/threonine protein kinase
VGHPEGNPEDSIAIKVFKNSPDLYSEELVRAAIDKYTVLLDKDEKNMILVEKVYKSFTVMVRNTQFVLVEKLADTPGRMVFIGHIVGDSPNNRLILKFYSKNFRSFRSFITESKCMKELGRRVEFGEDRSKYSLVEKYIDGRLLKDVLDDLTIDRNDLFSKCRAQIDFIHRKLKMSHNKIKAYNIIVSNDGQVHFLDFSNAQNLSSDEKLASEERLNDMKELLLIFRRGIPRLSSSPFK